MSSLDTRFGKLGADFDFNRDHRRNEENANVE